MAETVRLDIVDMDDGYTAYYVNGRLLRESGEHDIREIIDIVKGKYVESMTYQFRDYCGEDQLDLPEKYEDIKW